LSFFIGYVSQFSQCRFCPTLTLNLPLYFTIRGTYLTKWLVTFNCRSNTGTFSVPSE
jgi:hypothetical protein